MQANPQARTLVSGGYQPYQAPAAGVNTFLPAERQISDQAAGISGGGTAPSRTLNFGGDTTSNQTQTAGPNLGKQLMEMLLQSQRLGTAKFKNASFNLQDQQADRVMSTPSSLIGASPSQQASARNSSANALSPSINAADQLGQTFGEQLQGFGNQVNAVNSYLQQEAARADAERASAREVVQNALTTFGSKAFDIIDPKIVKLAGYDANQLEQAKATLKEQEMAAKMQKSSLTQVSPGATLYDSATGESVFTAPTKPDSYKPTEGDKVNRGYAAVNKLVSTPGVQDASTDVPYTDASGYFTVQGFKTLLSAAREDGISRDDFIKQYASYLSPYGITSGSYGLTEKEKKDLVGSGSSSIDALIEENL